MRNAATAFVLLCSLLVVSNGWTSSSSRTRATSQQSNSPTRQDPPFLSSSTPPDDVSLEQRQIATQNETSSLGAVVVESTEISEGRVASKFRLPTTTTTTTQILGIYQDYRIFWMTCLAIAGSTWISSGWALRHSSLMLTRRNILAGSIIFTVGDFGGQILTHWSNINKDAHSGNTAARFQLDGQRLIISTVLGVIWAGLSVPYVYSSIEHMLPGSSSLGRVLLKMAISCSILSTAGNYATMLFRRYVGSLCDIVAARRRQQKDEQDIFKATNSGNLGSLLRLHFQQCIQSCNLDFGEVLRDDLKIWPLYDILCYSVIPPTLRPITTAIMSSLWSMYMSIASAKDTNTSSDLSEGGDKVERTTQMEEKEEPTFTMSTNSTFTSPPVDSGGESALSSS